jgi:hypothetical protein
MKQNVGSLDKIIRIIIGMAVIGIGVVTESWWGLLGVIPLATAFTGFCGLYTLLGITTCKTRAISHD